VQLRDGIIRNVTQSSHPSFNTLYRAPVWDHTGKAIYLLTLDALWRVSIPEGALTELARIPDKQLLEIVSARSGRFWSPDSGRSMYILTRDQETKKTAFYKVNLTTGKSASLLEEEKFCSYDPIFAIDASDTGTRFVYLIEDVQHPAEIWIADADVPNPRRLTEINPKLDSYEMGTSRLIEWTTAAGQKLRGALLLPAGYEPGRRYPMIVAVYGGNYLSNYVYQFGLTQGSLDNMQLFATRGYAVLLPDAPLRVGTPMNDIANTILPGVDKVVELGIADPKSIGLRGNSYGGYTVLALLVQTPRFKAAVVSAAQGNLIGKYDSLTGERALGIEWAERGQGRMGGSPWEYRDRYIQNSPVFFFDKVETPLLVLHGSRDIGVPVFLAEELFVSLRRLGKEVELARYEGESHVIMGYRNRLDYLERMIEWFDSKLKPLDSRIPKSGIPDPKLQ
jgi:dipeptidyl aminopeptidase/acylaminoacyl peptidase